MNTDSELSSPSDLRALSEGILISQVLASETPYKNLILSKITPPMFENLCYQQAFKIAQELTESGETVDLISISKNISLGGIYSSKDLVQTHLDFYQSMPSFQKDANMINSAIEYLQCEFAKKELEFVLEKKLTITKTQDISLKKNLDSLAFANEEESKILQRYVLDQKNNELCTDWGESILNYLEEARENYTHNPNWLNDSVPKLGIPELDSSIPMCLKPSSLTILAARPGIGKTTFSLQLALSVVKQGYKAAFYCFEMTREELGLKLLSCATQKQYSQLMSGNYSKSQHDDYKKVLSLFQKNSPLILIAPSKEVVIDRGINSLKVFAANLKEMGVNVLFVDYLQIIESPIENVIERLTSIAYSLKEIAIKYNMSVVCLSQLKRDTQNRENYTPSNADLSGSSGLEAAADNIICLFNNKDKEGGKVIKVTKNRYGVPGVLIELDFDGGKNSFSVCSQEKWDLSSLLKNF